jgi:hypothetical protein
MMLLQLQTAVLKKSVSARYLSSSVRRASPVYDPHMVERREGEGGSGGRSSEAMRKVALFGASGFLGNYVCAELGTFLYAIVMQMGTR